MRWPFLMRCVERKRKSAFQRKFANSRSGTVGYCPNFYRGGESFLEKFTQKQQIEIKLEEKADNSLIITYNDMKKFRTKTKKGGAFGSIYFLQNYDLENDHRSKDNNESLKSKIVIKKQARRFKSGTEIKTANKCFAFKGIRFYLYLIMGSLEKI